MIDPSTLLTVRTVTVQVGRVVQVRRQQRAWVQVLDVLGEDLATTAAAFDVLEGVEAAFDRVIGPVDHAHPSRAHPDRVTRERGAVLLQMGEDDVDRIALVGPRSGRRRRSKERSLLRATRTASSSATVATRGGPLGVERGEP